jgi:cytochrome c6
MGKNLILPEKNLKKESLEATGMNSLFSLSYQIRNGKNGMPAFGDRLRPSEIEEIALYILKSSDKNFENP